MNDDDWCQPLDVHDFSLIRDEMRDTNLVVLESKSSTIHPTTEARLWLRVECEHLPGDL